MQILREKISSRQVSGQNETGKIWDRARWIWVFALIGGVSYFFAGRLGVEGLAASVWKTSGVGLLACWALLNARGPEGRWIAVVLAFGAAGDFLLAELGLLVGGATFGVGHLIAIAFYLSHRRRKLSRSQRLFALLVTPLALIIAWQLARGSGGELLVAALGYTVIVALMTASAWCSRFPRYRTGLGAVLFLASDLFIFAGEGGTISREIASNLVWPLYFGGQALIAWGVVRSLSLEADRT